MASSQMRFAMPAKAHTVLEYEDEGQVGSMSIPNLAVVGSKGEIVGHVRVHVGMKTSAGRVTRYGTTIVWCMTDSGIEWRGRAEDGRLPTVKRRSAGPFFVPLEAQE